MHHQKDKTTGLETQCGLFMSPFGDSTLKSPFYHSTKRCGHAVLILRFTTIFLNGFKQAERIKKASELPGPFILILAYVGLEEQQSNRTMIKVNWIKWTLPQQNLSSVLFPITLLFPVRGHPIFFWV